MRTVTAMFDSRAEAETARSRLAAAGVSNDHVTIHDKTSLDDRDRDGRQDSSQTGQDRGGLRDTGTQSGVVYGSDTRTATDYAVANPQQSQARGGDADGREGTHRNAIGDYIDNRTGEPLTGETGSDRTALGDYVDTGNLRSEERVDRDDHASVGRDDRHLSDNDDHRGVWDRIKAFFTGDDHIYEEGLRRGGYLLTARVQDHDAERVIDILDDEGTVDLADRQDSWRNEGWSSDRQNDTTRGNRVRSYNWLDEGR